MPATLSYPGVYIEEISSGVHTITGVATSITAFVGRTLRGPVNDPITINSFADFERIFGGLWQSSPLSFAVRDFYLNGGSQAVILRLYASLFADDQARTDAISDATTKATAAANAVSTAAANEAALSGATPTSVMGKANIALAAIDADVTETAPARAAARAVAAAVKAEAEKARYMKTDQQLDVLKYARGLRFRRWIQAEISGRKPVVLSIQLFSQTLSRLRRLRML